jgi:hypothetical protein
MERISCRIDTAVVPVGSDLVGDAEAVELIPEVATSARYGEHDVPLGELVAVSDRVMPPV